MPRPPAARPTAPARRSDLVRAVAVLVLAAAGAWAAAGPEVTVFPLATPGHRPQAIALGGDGNLWVTEVLQHRILRVAPDGVIAELAVPGDGVGVLQGIAWGPDGALWFTSREENAIRRLSADGVFAAPIPIPSRALAPSTLNAGSWPRAIARGGDGRLWFTEMAADQVAALAPDGTISEWRTPTAGSAPYGIAWLDGKVWFSESAAGRIGCLDPATGAIREFPLGDPACLPRDLTVGPDGAVWFSENKSGRIGRLAADGTLAEFPCRSPQATPIGIAAGADGDLWFCEFRPGRIGHVSPDGTMGEEVVIDVPDAKPFGICAGPDGDLWVALQANAVARIRLPRRR